MSWLDRFRRRRDTPAGPGPSPETQTRLSRFMDSRDGVEAFVEPPTSVYAMTLCLVAADGEYLRQPVRDERQARKLCGEHGVPLYDARIVGYPKRMREYERGVRQQQVSLEDLPPLDVVDPERRED
ncbi:MAG: oxidoreductase [Euzebyales bacterium]|nr:oxidoreductase [Euzebyales bacterium]MBA3620805.1 oxidoreductase [Euzebyales bacterium]